MTRVMALAAATMLLVATSCSGSDDVEPPADHGSLTGTEYDLAVDTAKQHRPPCDKDVGCPVKRLVYIRLVWKADASFVHSGPVTRPDGPHKALLIAVDPETDDIVSRAAAFWSVVPDAEETMLYGQRL